MGRPVRMIMKGLEKQEIKFANGAYGGFGPQATMFATFFLEHYLIPDNSSGEIGDTGKVIPDVQNDCSELIIEREVVAKLAFDLDTAKRVHEWLGKRIELYEQNSKRPVEGVESNGGSGSKS